jgi:hypothetical protein
MLIYVQNTTNYAMTLENVHLRRKVKHSHFSCMKLVALYVHCEIKTPLTKQAEDVPLYIHKEVSLQLCTAIFH